MSLAVWWVAAERILWQRAIISNQSDPSHNISKKTEVRESENSCVEYPTRRTYHHQVKVTRVTTSPRRLKSESRRILLLNIQRQEPIIIKSKSHESRHLQEDWNQRVGEFFCWISNDKNLSSSSQSDTSHDISKKTEIRESENSSVEYPTTRHYHHQVKVTRVTTSPRRLKSESRRKLLLNIQREEFISSSQSDPSHDISKKTEVRQSE
jgi:hypothetical protein